MSKKKVRRLSKKYYVSDPYGRTDEMLVGKVNELIDIINSQQEEIAKLKLILKVTK